MKHSHLRLVKPEFIMGAALLALRTLELRAGFDSATGLAQPTLLRPALIAAVLLFTAVELILCRRAGKDALPFSQAFAAPTAELPAAVTGMMLLAAGGAILLVQAIAPPTAVVELATGAMALVSAAGLFLLIRQLRAGDEPSLTAALPLMFFGVFLVLAIYLPFASDPILERYWLPVLAAAAQAFSLAQLTGFFRRESKPRQFLFAGNTAVFLCLATLADPLPLAVRLLLAGSAVTLATFTLLLQKAE